MIEFNNSNYMTLRVVSKGEVNQTRFDILDHVDEFSLSVRLNKKQISELIEFLKERIEK